jgi:hypothetical protein
LSITSLSPADLIPLLCTNCGAALQGGDNAALFLCAACGLAYEPGEEGLVSFPPLTAAVTTELAVAGPMQYLAVWRLAVSISAAEDSAWEGISKAVTPRSPCLYVPAFSLVRPVVQRLGMRLTETQPDLELAQGPPEHVAQRLALVEVATPQGPGLTRGGSPLDSTVDAAGAALDFGFLSPVVAGRKDARVLAHFVYLAVESHETRDLRSVDYELQTLCEELILIPAVWDPRYIHEASWRLLLREFDGLVA